MLLCSIQPKFTPQKLKQIFCRAKIIAVKAGSAGDGHGVPAGTYVDLHLADVPQEAAEKVLQRIEAAKKVR